MPWVNSLRLFTTYHKQKTIYGIYDTHCDFITEQCPLILYSIPFTIQRKVFHNKNRAALRLSTVCPIFSNSRNLVPTVHLVSQCKRIFGNILLHLTRSSSNSPRSFEGFRQSLKQNFNWIRQQMKNFPIDPNYKIRPLSATLWRCRKRATFKWGSMEKFFNRCWIWKKFRLRDCLKPSNDRGEFELDWARCNKNIAENSFALGHETDKMLISD